jgi:hypothetical protein
LTTDAKNNSFAIFYYNVIQWTAATDTSDHACVGFDAGDPAHPDYFYLLPDSCTSSISTVVGIQITCICFNWPVCYGIEEGFCF